MSSCAIHTLILSEDPNVQFAYEQPTKIEWKDATKNLTKLHPRIFDPEDDTDVQEPGSFFNIFESTKVTRDVYETEIIDIYENAIDFFLNRAEGVRFRFSLPFLRCSYLITVV